MNQQRKTKTQKTAVSPKIRVFIIAMAALCLMVAFSLAVYHLPASLTLFDTSDHLITHVSKTSEDFVAGLSEDVTLYWLCQNGLPDNDFGRFLVKYTDASKHIRLRIINTTDNPDFSKKYTSAVLSNYSLIVESNQRYQVIDTLDMYYFTNEYIDYIAGGTYQISASQYNELYKSYGTAMDQTKTYQYFQGEKLLTSALDYVTTELIPRPYLLTGHDEAQMSDSLKKIMDSAGLTPKTLDLSREDSVPKDASCIILFSPKKDLSEKEASLLKSYLLGGGSFLLVAGPDTADFTQLSSVTELYGMAPSGGIVVDTNTQCYRSDYRNLLPLINSNHSAMYAIGSMGYLAYMPESMGITMAETPPAGVTVQAMLGTSDTGYRVSKDSAMTPLCKPSAQIVAASGTLATTTENGTVDNAYFAWFASDAAFTDEALTNTSYGNYFYLTMTAKWMTGDAVFTSKFSTLAATDLTIPTLDGLTTTTSVLFAIMAIAIIPLAFVITGVIILLKRRNR